MRTALRADHERSHHRRRRLGDKFLLMLAVVLMGYALAGKGFAYAGIAPLYIGEACLAVGLIAWLSTRGWHRVFREPAALAILPLALWGAIRLVPGFVDYRVDAIRDAVIWGYAAFAVVVATLIAADPHRLPRLVRYYRRFI